MSIRNNTYILWMGSQSLVKEIRLHTISNQLRVYARFLIVSNQRPQVSDLDLKFGQNFNHPSLFSHTM